MSRKQNHRPQPHHSTSYSRPHPPPPPPTTSISFFAPHPKPTPKPKYIHKQLTPTNTTSTRIPLTQDQSPLPYQYDNNKDTFRKVQEPSCQLTTKSNIKQTLRINLKYQETLKENKELRETIEGMREEVRREKEHGEQAKKKFSSMIKKIVMVLESLRESVDGDGGEEPEETLEYVGRKLQDVLGTLDQYPFNN